MSSKLKSESTRGGMPNSPPVISGRWSPWRVMDHHNRKATDNRRHSITSQEVAQHTQSGESTNHQIHSGNDYHQKGHTESPMKRQDSVNSQERNYRPGRTSPWRNQYGGSSTDLAHRSGRESPWRLRPESPWRGRSRSPWKSQDTSRGGRQSPWRATEIPSSYDKDSARSAGLRRQSSHEIGQTKSGRESPWRETRAASPWRATENQEKSGQDQNVSRPGRESPWREMRQRSSSPFKFNDVRGLESTGERGARESAGSKSGRESPWRDHTGSLPRNGRESPWRYMDNDRQRTTKSPSSPEKGGRESPWRDHTGSLPRSGRESPWRDHTGSLPRSGRESPWRDHHGSLPRGGRESPWRVMDPAHRALETPRGTKSPSSPTSGQVSITDRKRNFNDQSQEGKEKHRREEHQSRKQVGSTDTTSRHRSVGDNPVSPSRSTPSTPRGSSGRETPRILVKGRNTPIKAIDPEFSKQMARNRCSWSGTGSTQIAGGSSKIDSNVKILKTSSFLQRAREAQERERNRLGLQDDTIVPKEASLKPRKRRIESFHGSRSRLRATPNSVLTSPIVVPKSENQSPKVSKESQVVPESKISNLSQNDKGDNSGETAQMDPETQKLKGWATVEDLTQRHQLRQQLLQNSQGNHYVNQEQLQENRNHGGRLGGQLESATSTTSLNMANQWRNSHPKPFPGGQSQQIQSPPQPPSSLSLATSSPDFHNSYGHGQSSPHSTINSQQNSGKIDQYSNRGYGGYNNRQGYKHVPYPGNFPLQDSRKSQEIESPRRQSMPAYNLKNQQNDYQNLMELKSAGLHQHPQKIEGHHDIDTSPSSPPPPPPKRDISSLKYVNQATAKNHEKYPSWPVTQNNPEMETEAPQVGAWPVRDKPSAGDVSQKGYKPQLIPVNERTSPNSERKTSEQENKRNQSDPGFKKANVFKTYIKRPTQKEIEQSQNQEKARNKKTEYVDNFFNSQPGYPKPLMDQDGNRIGDAKYSVPSPPERDNPGPDQQTLQEKISSIVVPQDNTYKGNQFKSGPNMASSPLQSPGTRDNKIPDFYKMSYPGNTPSESANVQTLVDSSTSPLQSPKEKKFHPFQSVVSPNDTKDQPSAQIQQYSNNTRGLIVKQMLCYNTGTQTDTNARQNQMNQSVQVTSDFDNKHIRTSLGSDNDSSAKMSSPDVSKSSFNVSIQSAHEDRRGRHSSSRDSRNSSDISANFSEEDSQNYAPMMRKLSQEYISGKMHGFENKRLSGELGFYTGGARSPGSEQQSFALLPGMREAESYNSVIIHPNESSHPFGKDFNESDNNDDKHHKDSFKTETDRRSYPNSSSSSSYATRHSLDGSGYIQKYTSNKKGIRDTRYSSEANLVGNNMSQRDHSQSMLSLSSKHGKSDSYSGGYHPKSSSLRSSNASPMSHQSETRSSMSSQFSSQSSQHGQMNQLRSRKESTDSVFIDPSVEKIAGNTADISSNNASDSDHGNRRLGRNTSMKLAYGTYEGSEKTVPSNVRQNSDRLSGHVKSHSVSEYMPMSNQLVNRPASLGQIREDTSETRWEEALKKSQTFKTSAPQQEESNYANIDVTKMEKSLNKDVSGDQICPLSEKEEASEFRGNQREMRPPLPKRDIKSPVNVVPAAKQSNKSDFKQESAQPSPQTDSDAKNNTASPMQLLSLEADLKEKQRHALQNFMDRKTGKRTSSSDSSNDQPSIAPSPSFEEPETAHHLSAEEKSASKLTPTQSFREKYARRQESLKRSRSITSRDAADYVQMLRPSQPHPQTEWSKIRSQTSSSDGSMRRPLSVGSEASLVDPYAVTPITGPSSFCVDNESSGPQVTSYSSKMSGSMSTPSPQYSMSNSQSAGGSVSSSALDYVNVGYRKPPPIPPSSDDDKPPALPPRNYQRFPTSVSDSQLQGHHQFPKDYGDASPSYGSRKPRDDSPDYYAAQLRQQAKRFSVQQRDLKPTSMSYISSRPVKHYSQTSKRSPVEALEATPPGSVIDSSSPHQLPYSVSQSSELSSPSSITSSANMHYKDLSSPVTSIPQQQLSPRSSQGQSVTQSQSPWRDSKMDVNQNVAVSSHQSNISSQISYPPPPVIGSPELPPPPTPIKNPEVLSALNDLELPPPPPELMEEEQGKGEDDSQCADDSYGSHKNRNSRPIGVYKRSVSSGDILKNDKQPSQLKKPPRRSLGQQLWQSEANIGRHFDNEETGSVSESVPVATVTQSVAQPLHYSQSTTSLLGHKPFQADISSRLNNSVTENSNNESSPNTSVKDRISRYETKPSPQSYSASSRNIINNRKKLFELNRGQDGSEDTPKRPSNDRSSPGGVNSSSVRSNRQNVHYIGQYGANSDSHLSVQAHPQSAEGQESNMQETCDNVKTTPTNYSDISKDLLQNHLPISGRLYKSNDQSEKPPERPPKRYGSSQNVHKSGVSDNKSWEERTLDTKPPAELPPRRQSAPAPQHLQQMENGFNRNHGSQFQHSNDNEQPLPINHGRQRSQEELECDKRVHAFAKDMERQDKKLFEVLKQESLGRMTYMNELVQNDTTMVPVKSRHSPMSSVSGVDNSVTDKPEEDAVSKENQLNSEQNLKSSIPDNYWVSPSKALIEIDIRKSEDLGKKMTEDIADPDTLIKTKEELVDSIMKKREKLKAEKFELEKEIKEVDLIGKQVKETVTTKCRAQKEKDKFNSYLRERDDIIHLLLKMSGLLARAENALQGLSEDCSSRQRDMATQKRDRYKDQHEEATKLKADIDQRSVQVLSFLKESLTEREIEDYNYYINMKSKLTIELQDLDDKITLGDEQIQALRRSIPERK